MNKLAGTWLEKDGKRIVVVGNRRNGSFVVKNECGTIEIIHGFLVGDGWKVLPGCTGFDWVKPEKVEPETFPQYWTTIDSPASNVAYLIRTGPDEWCDCIQVMKDGTKRPISGCRWNTVGRRKMTKEQAEALEVDKEPEKDDRYHADWVSLPFNHILRHCDEIIDCFGYWVTPGKWPGLKAGDFAGARCRREDHPDYLKKAEAVVENTDLPPIPTRPSTSPEPSGRPVHFFEVTRLVEVNPAVFEIVWTSKPTPNDKLTSKVRVIDIPRV